MHRIYKIPCLDIVARWNTWTVLAYVVCALIINGGLLFAGNFSSVHAQALQNADSGDWAGDYETVYAYDMGSQNIHMHLSVHSTSAGYHVYGTFDGGTLDGYATYVTNGSKSISQLVGTWRTTDPNVTSPCSYGRLVFNLTARGNAFAGFWTFCDDDPINSSSRWAWSGKKIDA